MKSFRKILYLFLIIFTLSFSIDGEKSKVILDKRYDTAKLKIGVTKLISKELPLEFHAESKKIYGEIDIDENDLVFVSETLDEMPSVSTTNGRKSINNIKKYLTKEIKKSPKFEYRIVEEKPEADKTEGKKYLLIDCKEQLSGVYVYVVEKGSYKVKEVYKGVFRQLLKVQAKDISYGTIHVEKNMFAQDIYRRISYKGGRPVISQLSQGTFDKEDTEASNYIKLAGEYPKKLADGTKYDQNGLPSVKPYYEIKIYENGTEKAKSLAPLKGDKKNEINSELTLDSKTANEAVKLHIMSDSSSEYLYIDVRQPYPYEEVNYKIVVTYGEYATIKNEFWKNEVHEFYLVIEPQDKPILPENTTGTLYLKKIKSVEAVKPTLVSFDGKTGTVHDNSIFNYHSFSGEQVKIVDYFNEKYKNAFPEENENFLRISYTSNAEKNPKKWSKDVKIDSQTGIVLDNNSLGKVGIYDRYNMHLGNLAVIGANEKDKDKYFSLEFLPIEDYKWVNTHREIISTLTFEYITKIPNGTETILKKDTLNIVMYPVEEIIPPNTFGTLIIRDSYGLPGKNLFIKDGILQQERNEDSVSFDIKNASFSGQLPDGFAMNIDKLNNWVNIERGIKLVVVNSKQQTDTSFNYETGNFKTITSTSLGWIELHSDKSFIGRIFLSYGGIDDKKDSITIGFRERFPDVGQPNNFSWGRNDKGVYERYEFQYQIELDEGNWVTIKTDVLELIIQRELSPDEKPKIILKNPLVYYDYDESSALSNIVHNRRVYLAKDEAKTLNSNGTNFIKNTDLMGEDWIRGENQVDYEWKTLGEHKISINRGTDEVLKNTYENGGTKSSTFLSGDNTGELSKTKNEVIFSYDGGNKYLNFGLSKYNFDGETLSDIAVTHFENKGGFLKNRHTYVVEIPPFEGIHYVGNYDIKPRQSYTKNYAYDPTKPNTATITIDYGTVGFRNLDTRITNQSGGEGIDIRAVKKVKLVSEDEKYVIKNVKLFFEKEEPNDDNDKTSRFKGENEKATSAMLKLEIPVQETLIPKGRFKILTDDREDVDNYPLRVGVTINGKINEKYYTPIDDEPKGKDGKNLYLNITTNRFVETVIEFENPDLKNDNQGENWIRLDDTTYAGGVLSREIVSENGGTSNLWGRVKGDVIDIPADRYPHLKMVLFDENNNLLMEENLNTTNGKKEFSFGQGKNFIISRENPSDKHIRFTLDNGYDPVADAKTEIKFYIRYFDTSVEGKEDFLFDQRYIVRFKKKAEYKADTTVIFKNPAMAVDKTNADNGMINMSQSSSKGNDNSNTDYDKIEWYKVLNPIESYPDTNLISLTRIEDDKTINDYDKFLKIEDAGGKKVLYFGIPNERAKFEELFGGYNGNSIEKSFALKFAQDNSSSYRLNVVIEKFDPKYFGKVYSASLENEDYTVYKEINTVGTGNIDLTKSNLQFDSPVYVDLGTFYRDYLRYEALPKTLLNKKIEVKVGGKVEAVPKNSLYAEKINGELVLLDNGNYINLSTGSKEIEFTDDGKNMPKSYPLKLKLSQEEYKKLKPYTEYEIFFNEEQNVLIIGTDTLKDNIIFDRPLNFNTTGPSLKIETSVLDFGKIKPKEAKEDLIKKEGKTETPVRVIMSGEFDSELALQKTLVVDKDIIWLKQQSVTGEVMKNGGQLRVRDLKAVKHVTETPQIREGQEIIEEYDITGILEVPKDIDESKYGEYIEYLGVTYTFY